VGEKVIIKAAGGIDVPLTFFEGGCVPTSVLLVLPALGVKARFYRRFAEGLSEHGISVLLFEQRGHGDSPYRAARGKDFGYADYLDVDLPAAVEFAREKAGELPLYIAGHSLGGHMASIMAGQKSGVFSGLIHLACGFPYVGFYPGRTGLGVRFLAHIVPFLTFLFGFYPGEMIGFGGREYKRLMLDWRYWALKGGYDFPGRAGLEETVAKYNGPYLSVAFERDHFISEEALGYSRSRLTEASHTHVCLTKEEQGDHLGHFDWAKEPTGVVRLVTAWINDQPGLSR